MVGPAISSLFGGCPLCDVVGCFGVEGMKAGRLRQNRIGGREVGVMFGDFGGACSWRQLGRRLLTLVGLAASVWLHSLYEFRNLKPIGHEQQPRRSTICP